MIVPFVYLHEHELYDVRRMRECVTAYEGLMRVSRSKHTLICSPFSQYLIVFLLTTQQQRIATGKFMVCKYIFCESHLASYFDVK